MCLCYASVDPYWRSAWCCVCRFPVQEALRDRIVDGSSEFVVTADEGVRGGRKVPLKKTTDTAISSIPKLLVVQGWSKNRFLFQRTGAEVNFVPGRDLWMNRGAEDAMPNARPYIPCEEMDAEDTLFYLYTSGSTGKPKGIAHSTAGYLLYAQMTQKYVFDYREGDVYVRVLQTVAGSQATYIVMPLYAMVAQRLCLKVHRCIQTHPDTGTWLKGTRSLNSTLHRPQYAL